MSNYDLSQYSENDLQNMLNEHDEINHKSNIEKNNSLIKNALESYKDYAKGVGKGYGQFFGDIGAYAGNAPIMAAEYLTGKEFSHIPHPNLLSDEPSSLSESVGRDLSQVIAPLIPFGGQIGRGIKFAAKNIPSETMGAKRLNRLSERNQGIEGDYIPDELSQEILNFINRNHVLKNSRYHMEQDLAAAKTEGYKPAFEVNKTLGRIKRNYSRKDPDISMAAEKLGQDVVNKIHENLSKRINPEEAEEFKSARAQYRRGAKTNEALRKALKTSSVPLHLLITALGKHFH